ncbi:carbohydrate porin [Rhodoferax sp.]|uniref:carbohydrate porin n=1 Tax=Rhodoferax sp. TaxID=50421 RepID=UPI002716D87B|nr:carbohydrate porin [Rhodoferax sp.]MDO8317989.1 carbohydrate porin [Rhodoferax sp.]
MKQFNDITRHAKTVIVALGFSSLAAMAAGPDPQTPAAQADATGPVKGIFLPPETQTGLTPPGVASLGIQPPPGGPPPRMGPLSKLGDALEEHGVDLGLFLANGHFANPSAGVSTGNSVDYFEASLSANADLHKLIGIPNTKIHFTEAWQPPSNNTAKFSSQVAAALAPFPPTQTNSSLVKLTLSHDFLDDKLHVEYGRMNLTDDFMVANMCTGCFAATPLITLGVPPRDRSLLGARTSYALSPNTRLGFAVVEDNYDLQSTSNGWDWNANTRKGWIGVANLMHKTEFFDNPHPLNAEVGIYHNTSPYVDGNSFPVPIVLPGGGVIPVVTHDGGTWGLYGQARKVVWKAADAPPGPFPPNVALYGGAYVTPGAGQAFPFEAYAGVEYGGFLKDNPIASIGSTWRYLQLSKERASFEEQHGYGSIPPSPFGPGSSGSPVPRDTFAFDVHGQYGIAPGVLVNAVVQYFLNPNRMGPSLSVGDTHSGWLFGVFLVADIGRITGLR